MITIEDVKLYLKIEDSEVGDDLFIEKCIDFTFSEIENYCRQSITETEQETTFLIVGNSILFNDFPINSISEIKIYDSDLVLIDTLQNTDYTLLKSSSLYYCILNSNMYNNYYAKITYSCGYAAIPKDIQKIHLEMTALMFKESDVKSGFAGGRLGLTSMNDGINQISKSVNFQSPIEKWNKILNHYRKPIG